MFVEKKVIEKAKRREKTIVFPEAGFSERTVEAAKIISKKQMAKVILIGDESALDLKYKNLKGVEIINPKTYAHTDVIAANFYNLRKEKGVTEQQAKEIVLNPLYFASMLVYGGYADGMVAGAESSTSDVIRPALQIIKAKEKGGKVSSCFVIAGKNKMLGKDKTMVIGDCGLNQNPTEDELVEIAYQCAQTAINVCEIEPRVAFLSYSTKGSAKNEMVDKVANAAKKFKEKYPEIQSDGELQLDAALIESVGKKKAPQSTVAGRANVLIFPDLNAGNICYKAIQYFGGVTAVGPLLQGLAKPVNDLSRGCSVNDIVLSAAITILQCEDKPRDRVWINEIKTVEETETK